MKYFIGSQGCKTMKKIIRVTLITSMLLNLLGCSGKEPSVVKLYEETDSELVITFEQAWKASGFSSNMDDYFKVEDATLVAMK